MPLLRYEMAVADPSAPRRGIIPEYPFQPTIQQVLAKEDAELEYVLNLIQQEQHKTKTPDHNSSPAGALPTPLRPHETVVKSPL